MNVLLLDTNVVSILFNRNHSLRQTGIEAVAGHQLVISFMTRAELLLWPAANNWGAARRTALGSFGDRPRNSQTPVADLLGVS
jgi:predicted nucleic acid-binding protein